MTFAGDRFKESSSLEQKWLCRSNAELIDLNCVKKPKACMCVVLRLSRRAEEEKNLDIVSFLGKELKVYFIQNSGSNPACEECHGTGRETGFPKQ